MNPAVELALAAAFGIQPLSDPLYVLGVILVRDEHRIRGLNDDQVLDPDGGDHALLRVQQIVAGIDCHHITVAGISGIVVLGDLP